MRLARAARCMVDSGVMRYEDYPSDAFQYKLLKEDYPSLQEGTANVFFYIIDSNGDLNVPIDWIVTLQEFTE